MRKITNYSDNPPPLTIYLPDELPDYPGRDGTREGAERAAHVAIQNSLAMQKTGKLTPSTKCHVSGIEETI